VQPDDRKVQAIQKIKRPETKDVKRTLGVINYLARFMPPQSVNSKVLCFGLNNIQHGNGLLNTKNNGTRSNQF